LAVVLFPDYISVYFKVALCGADMTSNEMLTAGGIKYHQHLLFPLCWPKYLKLTSCRVDDSNEFMVQIMFWAAGSPVFLDANIQHHKRRAVRIRAYMKYFIASHFLG
jgi:hypothetical protein